MKKVKKELFSKTVDIVNLSFEEITDMYKIFSKYYENSDYKQFVEDLNQKDKVFLLIDKRSKELKGFSTIVNLLHKIDGKEVRGVFSGDTIVEKEYWGQGTLGIAFLRYLFLQKLRNPLQPLYWFLISKGYKTYLLMANNFTDHYPRYDKTTPAYEQEIVDGFSKKLYGDYYNKEKGIISFSNLQTKDCLKENVTPISDELIESNKRIAYFAKYNPNWRQGDELACLAQMTFYMPIYYQFKFMKKKLSKIWRKTSDRFKAAVGSKELS